MLSSHDKAGTFLGSPALQVAAEVMVSEQSATIVGSQIGPYKINSLLGSGGMGEVYLAEDTRLNRSVALKLLAAHFAHDEVRVHRFQQEALAASALNHPNIVTVHEVGEWQDRHFIVTEFVDGITLRTRMRRRRLSLADALDIAAQISGALSVAHSAGIVHRDIKPENVMLRPDGLVKILDFGIAKFGGVSDRTRREALVKTSPGEVIGTAAYMSPEQARGQPVDARTDIWSLGAILYEMVTHRLPFPGATPTDRIAAILGQEPAPLSKQRRRVPPELERIVSRTLAKNKEERYYSAPDLAADLRKFRETLAPQRLAGFDLPAPMRSLISFTRGRMLIALLLLALVVGAVIAGYFYFGDQSTRIDSLAVLPLVNVSNDPNTEYLSDGITESIISNLSQVPRLRVMARATVFSFKGKEINPQDVGRQLGVKAVLMGRLIQQGERLIIRTELVKVADGSQLWGAEYDRNLSDVLAVQQEISREISSNLRLKLTGDEQKRLTGHDTNNTEAYRLYLLGLFHWNKFTEGGVKKSIEYFNQALEKDPNYALAYTGLAGSYGVLGQISLPPREAIPKSKAYVEKALALDETLAEAHCALAANNFFYDWDWKGAEQEFKRAIELNPNFAQAHNLYGQYLNTMGRFDEAVVALKRSSELDPLAPLHRQNLGLIYYYARRYDLTVAESKKALELDPNFSFAAVQIGWAYGQQGKYQDAVAELDKARQLPSGFAMATSELGYVYAVSGRKAEAQKLIQELKSRTPGEYIDPYFIAIIYLGLGNREQTFEWLEKAYEARSNYLPWLRVEPKFDVLRCDQRYADMVGRMGLQF